MIAALFTPRCSAPRFASLALVILAFCAPSNVGAQDICPTSTGPVVVADSMDERTVAPSSTCPNDRVAPQISTESHNGDYLDPADCIAECFEAVAAYTTPAFTSLDVS